MSNETAMYPLPLPCVLGTESLHAAQVKHKLGLDLELDLSICLSDTETKEIMYISTKYMIFVSRTQLCFDTHIMLLLLIRHKKFVSIYS